MAKRPYECINTLTSLIPSPSITPKEKRNETSLSNCLKFWIINNVPISHEKTILEFNRYWTKECEDEAIRLSHGVKISRPLEVPGMTRIKRIIKDFNDALDTWQSFQSDIFFNMLNCNKRLILGNDYVNCVSVVNELYGWKDEPDECLMIAYRGCGKSTLLAHIVAAFLKEMESYDAMVYSGDITKSKDLLNSIWSAFENMMDNDPDFRDEFYITKNARQISVWSKNPKNKDKRTIRTTSSFSKTMDEISKGIVKDFLNGIESGISTEILPLSQRARKELDGKCTTEIQKSNCISRLKTKLEQIRMTCKKIGRITVGKYLNHRIRLCKSLCQQIKYVEDLDKEKIHDIMVKMNLKRYRKKVFKKNNSINKFTIATTPRSKKKSKSHTEPSPPAKKAKKE